MSGKLVLENGLVLEGEDFGNWPLTVGKVVFFTGVVGYQELLTDPDYHGLIVIATYPEIGNYGVNEEDNESSAVHPAGFVIKKKSLSHSNFRAMGSVDDFVLKHNLPLLHEVETRQAVIALRDEGEMIGALLPDGASPEEGLRSIAEYKIRKKMDIVIEIAVKETIVHDSHNGKGPRIALLDLGVKNSLIAQLARYGCSIMQFPPETSPDTLLNEKPDGIIISNGPDDANGLDPVIEHVKALIGAKPILGVSLGCQALGKALGGELATLKCGHHGVNQPVKNPKTGKVEITSQAHSFCLTTESLEAAGVEVTWENLNDHSVEAFSHTESKATGYQICLAPPTCLDINPFLKEFLDGLEKKN